MIVVPHTYVKHTEAEFLGGLDLMMTAVTNYHAARSDLGDTFRRTSRGRAAAEDFDLARQALLESMEELALHDYELCRQGGMTVSVIISCPGQCNLLSADTGSPVVTPMLPGHPGTTEYVQGLLHDIEQNALHSTVLIDLMGMYDGFTSVNPFVEVTDAYKGGDSLIEFFHATKQLAPKLDPQKNPFKESLTARFGDYAGAKAELVEDVLWKHSRQELAGVELHTAMIQALSDYLSVSALPPQEALQDDNRLQALLQLV